MSAIAARAPRVSLNALAVLAVVATCAAVAAVQTPVASFVLIALAAGVLALEGRSLQLVALVSFGAVLAIDNPQENPADGKWQSPLYDAGTWLFDNLNKATGIEALHFSLLDTLVVALALATWLRRPRGLPGCAPLRQLCMVAGLALVASEGWGLVRGGDFRNSLWQIRQPMAGPVLAVLFARLIHLRRDRSLMGAMILGAAFVKAGLGFYVYETIFRPLNEKPAYTTIHSDSVLFVVAMAVVLGMAVSRRTWGSVALASIAAPILGAAILVNNRRLAWVEIGITMLVLYALLPRNRTKRFIAGLALASVPVIAIYLAAGWNSTASVFRPAQMVRSLGDSERDRSSATRDIENYNLVQTLKSNPLLGVGFGHEYNEVSKADDISVYFPQYRYIPHNSFLGLWAFAGWLGFTLVWLPLSAGLYLAARSYQRAKTSLDRTTAIVVVAALVAYTVQCWGDMGFQSWPGTFIEAAALAAAGQLAVSVGAWPAPPVETYS